MTLSTLNILYFFVVFCLLFFGKADACQSCLFPPLHRHHHIHHHTPSAAVAIALQLRQRPPVPSSSSSTHQLSRSFLVGFAALKSHPHPIAKPIAFAVGAFVTQRCTSAFLRAAEEEATKISKEDDDDDDDNNEDVSSKESSKKPPMTQVMVATIGVYKNLISPLLPPACRFVPTCSQYGVQAIEEFGPTKGCILTAWRLLRCSPFGGKGFDPPKWPPVEYTYSGSYF